MLIATRNGNFSNYIRVHMSNVDISVLSLANLPRASL